MLADRYRIVGKLGSGGMAEVFEAVATGAGGFERRVAIKRVREGFGDESFNQMFLDEARIASHLHHANVVSVLDYGVADDRPFQVLAFVDGIDCRRLVRGAAAADLEIPIAVALYLCREVAHGMHHAHVAVDPDGEPLGIVHRDIKPANILVSWEGDVVLLDFGVAFANRRLAETQAGVAKGTLLYMAPEQAMAGEIDARTDVFALGCVLHEMCAGASPLAGEGAMADLVCGRPPPIDPSLPDDVRGLIECSVQLERANRFESAAAMAEAIGGVLAGRSQRSGRALAVEFLQQLRPELGERSRSLDPYEIELVVDEPGLESRRFATAATSVERPASGAEAPARRSRAALAIAAAAVLIAAVAAVAFVSFGRRSIELPAAPELAALAPPVDAAPAVADPADAAPPIDASIAADAREPPSPPPTRRPPHAASKPDAAPITPPTTTATGYLRIGGDGALGMAILVDGVRRAYAPRRLSIPVGRHLIELRDREGKNVAKRRVDIRPEHTRSKPLAWLVP